MKRKFALAFVVALVVPEASDSHSQLFMKPQAWLVGNSNQDLAEIRTVWRFEAVSSAMLSAEFDRNASGVLEHLERERIAKAVQGKTSPFTAETHLVQNGHNVPLTPPTGIRIDVLGEELVISFSVKPTARVRIADRLSFWMDDSKGDMVLDFKKDADLKATGSAFEKCRVYVVRPGTEAATTRNQAMATEMFFSDPGSRNRLTSTRLEIDCHS